jgi:transposase InsO family protein
MRAIDAEVKQEYGWPRMHNELLARGIRVGKERVWHLMQQHGIKAKTKRQFVVTSDSRLNLPVAPDLVQRRFDPEAPNRLWSRDITYATNSTAKCRKRLELPTAHGQQKRIALQILLGQFLVCQVLLRKILRNALHSIHEG